MTINKFGDFDDNCYNKHRRGHVDPVFAARLCFFTWLLLSSEERKQHITETLTVAGTTNYNSVSFLTEWLNDKLHLLSSSSEENDNEEDTNAFPATTISHQKRLPCAAILRALLWNEGTNSGNATSKANNIAKKKCLAEELQISSKFLFNIAQSCCGLVECLPKDIAFDAIIQKQYHNIHVIPSTSLDAVAAASL